jgi:hypothetical protein
VHQADPDARNVTESSAFFDRKLTAPLGTLPRPSGPTRAQFCTSFADNRLANP